MWEAWIAAKSSDSSDRTTLLVKVEVVLTGPLGRSQTRPAVPDPLCESRRVRLDPAGELFDTDRAGERTDRLTPHHPQQAGYPFVAEILELGGVGVEPVLDVVPPHRWPDAESGIEPTVGEQIDSGQVLGQPQRVLPTQRDDRGPEVDPPGPLRGGRQHGQR